MTLLILGAGTLGLSTAYTHLKTHPSIPVTILDRFPAPSPPAASTDINKIIRADYTNGLYMDLATEAMMLWKTLPFLASKNIYHETGWIATGEGGSDTTTRIKENFRERGGQSNIVDMSEGEVKGKWPVLDRTDCSGFESYYHNPSAGWADSGAAVKAMAEEVVKMGGEYVAGEIKRLILGDQGAEGVETVDGRVFRADKILLATGAWTSKLLGGLEDELDLEVGERVEKRVCAVGVCVAHFRLGAGEREVFDEMPVFVYGGQGEVIPPTESGVLKFTFSTSFKNTVTTESGHEISVPVENQLDVPHKLQEDCIRQIRARLPQMLDNGRRPDYYRLCWDSMSPDQHPLITRHPDPRLGNLSFAVGGSFHSFKFLPTIGKYVVNVLDGVSNGELKDKAWGWKDGNSSERGVHESLVPKKEFRDFV